MRLWVQLVSAAACAVAAAAITTENVTYASEADVTASANCVRECTSCARKAVRAARVTSATTTLRVVETVDPAACLPLAATATPLAPVTTLAPGPGPLEQRLSSAIAVDALTWRL